MENDGLESISVKRALELIARGLVGLVMTTGCNPARDYKVRRLAADMAVPLVLNHRLALELSRSIARYEGVLEDDVRDMSSYWSLGLVAARFG